MDKLQISVRKEAFHIEGFPSAVKAITFKSPKLRRLGHLWLHLQDLEFAETCLQDLNTGEPIKATVSEALWRSAIVHYFKCYGSSKSRGSLSEKKILKHIENGLLAHQVLRELRDKHIVHDDNPFSAVATGAALNDEKQKCKVAKVICVSNHIRTLNQETWNNLRLLIEITKTWVTKQFDELCEDITQELEKKPYHELFNMESMSIECHSWDAISESRDARKS